MDKNKLNKSNNKENSTQIMNVGDENKSEETNNEEDPVIKNFKNMIAKIFLRGILIIFILSTLVLVFMGNFKTNMLPYITIKGAICILMNLLIIPRFKKHTMWIIIWISILIFISIFLYPQVENISVIKI